MARVRPVTQRLHDPALSPSQRRNAGLGQPAEVAGIGESSETKAQRGNIAMLLENRQRGDRAALSVDGVRQARLQSMLGHDWRVFATRRRLEAIAEAGAQRLRCRLLPKKIDPPPPPP